MEKDLIKFNNNIELIGSKDIVKYIEYYNVLYTKEPLCLNKWSISLVDIK